MLKVFVDTNFGVNPAKGHLSEDRDRIEIENECYLWK